MKKKIKIGCLIIFVFIITGMYCVYDFIFPKAPKLDFPDYSLVQSITVSEGMEPINISEQECEALYKYISTAKRTRNPSIHDMPAANPLYLVDIKSDQRSILGYVYQEYGNYYFEIPYTGVYMLRIKKSW